MIEPAAYGAAVSFGPNTWNFRDVVQRLLQADAAELVQDGAELTRFVQRCLEQPDYRTPLGPERPPTGARKPGRCGADLPADPATAAPARFGRGPSD